MKTKHVDLGPLPNNLSMIVEQGGQFGLGYLYDFWTLNDQITVLNGLNKTGNPGM